MNMKKTMKIAGLICLTLLMVALPLLGSACGTGEKTLKIGITTPTTGKAAEKGSLMGHANLDAIEYVNTELGGVGGYTIEVEWLDNAYDPGKMVNAVQKFMDDNCLIFINASSAMMTAAMTTANQNEFPGIAAFTAPILYRPPEHVYGQLPDYGDDWIVFAEYYMENIWDGEGKPKMALHLLANSTGYGALDGAKAMADELGIELILPPEEHLADTISETESLTRIKAQDPDVLYIASTPAPASVIIQNAYELGMLDDMTVACGHAAFTQALVDLAGADIVEGVYGVFPTVAWGDDVPGMDKMTEYCLANHPDDYGNMDYITSWAQSLIVAEILRLTLEEVGYDVLAAGGVEAWNAIEEYGIQRLDYDVEGLHGEVKYVAGDNRLSKSLRVFQIESGEMEPITDWIDAPVVEYENFDWFGN